MISTPNTEKLLSDKNDGNKGPVLKLPSVIRYFDEVMDEEISLRNPLETDYWNVQFDAKSMNIDFSVMPESNRNITKYYLGTFLVNQQTGACCNYYTAIKNFYLFIGSKKIKIAEVGAIELRGVYDLWRREEEIFHYATSLRLYISFLAKLNYGLLNERDIASIKAWPTPQSNKHTRVRSGSHKLSFYEELQITNYLTTCVARPEQNINSRSAASQLLANAILTVCFCLGPRQKQLAMLKISDIRAYESEVAHSYYDIAIPILKQKKSKKENSRKALPTKWQEVVLQWWEYRKALFPEMEWGTTPLFSLNDRVSAPPEFTRIIKELTGNILGEPKTVYSFRHTFAQRLADNGCSATGLATALTHSTTETAQVYVESSPDMARIISEAIGKSEVYKDVPDLFTGRLVVKPDYDTAPNENKVEGVVDGTWMPGIGLCDVSIKLCDKSPLLACHTCPKFMPLLDKEPHEALAGQLRDIVYRFSDTQVDQNKAAPPLAKLGGTLAVIEKLLVEIEETA